MAVLRGSYLDVQHFIQKFDFNQVKGLTDMNILVQAAMAAGNLWIFIAFGNMINAAAALFISLLCIATAINSRK
jgi:hypothetical protein